jgi:hypothetical protein
LAVNTNPMNGMVTDNVAGAFPVMFRAVDQLIDGTRLWELEATNTYGAYQLMTIGGLGEAALGGSAAPDASGAAADAGATADPADAGAAAVADGGLGAEAGAGSGAADAASGSPLASASGSLHDRLRAIRALPGLLSRGGLVRAVFVPTLLEPRGQGASGYTFDPANMLRLFVLGERTFLESDPEAVLRGLGWHEVASWLRPRLDSLKADARDRGRRFESWAKSGEAQARYREHREEQWDECFVTCCQQSLPLEPQCDQDLIADSDLAAVRPRMFWEPAQ